MPILHLAVIIVVAGFLLWLVNRYVPMQTAAKNLLNIVVIGALALWIVLLVLARVGPGPSI